MMQTYADEKLCWAPGKQTKDDLPVLSAIPQLIEIFADEEKKIARVSCNPVFVVREKCSAHIQCFVSFSPLVALPDGSFYQNM